MEETLQFTVQEFQQLYSENVNGIYEDNQVDMFIFSIRPIDTSKVGGTAKVDTRAGAKRSQLFICAYLEFRTFSGQRAIPHWTPKATLFPSSSNTSMLCIWCGENTTRS